MARRAALITVDPPGVRRSFAAEGFAGVLNHLRCSRDDTLEVLLALGLVPAAYRRRLDLARELVALDGLSHVAAAGLLGVSRWTVATYRRELGLDRANRGQRRSARTAAATA